ncbi:leucyl aminopeptidase [Candidatus Micrarchaeota archaeon]|nr:leucyl aminopeptidase [Candidatus Micrarchaeota archaeon]MBU2476924.1 leucyl aminopeptidase [Candidatus Micrarchaeota archaeon]
MQFLFESNLKEIKAGVLFVGLSKEQVKKQKKGVLSEVLAIAEKTDDFKGEKAQGSLIVLPKGFKAKKVSLIGLGEEKEITKEDIRKTAGSLVKAAKAKKIEDIAFVFYSNIKESDWVEAVSETSIMADYSFSKYKSAPEKPQEKETKIKKVFFGAKKSNELDKLVKEKEIIAENVNLVRDFVNENAKDKNPALFAKKTKEICVKAKIKCSVIDAKQLEKMGANLILAVGMGAKEKPNIVVLEYNGTGKKEKPIVLVGKGITFDSGGINLKPTGYIESMKQDMAGAATVLGIMKTAKELKLKKNLVGLMALAENAIGSNSFKPGDVFKGLNGKTVEIGNTDAEGRLVLADTIAFGVKKFKPKLLIDYATLTGLAMHITGGYAACFLTNKDELYKKMFDAGNEVFERVWQLPLYKEFSEDMKGEISDLKNASKNKFGGTSSAAAFLKEFIGETDWIHLDIAPTAFHDDKESEYCPKGGTGFGVRLTIEYLKK